MAKFVYIYNHAAFYVERYYYYMANFSRRDQPCLFRGFNIFSRDHASNAFLPNLQKGIAKDEGSRRWLENVILASVCVSMFKKGQLRKIFSWRKVSVAFWPGATNVQVWRCRYYFVNRPLMCVVH